MAALDDLVRPDRYPRSSMYDPTWLIGLDMGPNPLWLLEELAADLDLRAGMRVLDLGSGKGASSVFLAREFGVEVVAVDLWVPPDEASAVFAEAGVDNRVQAVRAEAHALPFAAGSFDAVVSIDAYEYFGTADHYLAYITRFLGPDGQLGSPRRRCGTRSATSGRSRRTSRPAWGGKHSPWHTLGWWRLQWEITELVTVTSARTQEHGWRDWILWHRAGRAARGQPSDAADPVGRMLEADQVELLTFALLSARVAPPLT